MKEYLTAQEIAAERLPLLPTTKRGINDLAEREGWALDPFRARKRRGVGGGMEFSISLLPSVAQVAYRQRHIPVGPLPAPVELQPETALSGRAALERDARLAILRAYEAFERGQRLHRQACETLFVTKYQAGTFAIEGWVRELVPAFSRRTLARWRAAAERDRNRLGVDRGAARKGTGVLDTANGGAVRSWMLGILAHQPLMTAEGMIEQCRAQFGDTIEVVRGGGVIERIAMPSLRTFQNALKALKITEKVVLTKATDPDRYRSHMRLAGTGSLRHVNEPNSLWQIDASPMDALCTDGRHAIYICIDIATRRPTIYVTKTPRAEAVGLLLRKAILAWGVPAEIKTDNGSDFTAKASERLLLNLGIERTLSDAYSPEQKVHVERLIKTFQHQAVRDVPGFVGHNVTQRKAIEGRKSFAQRLGEDEADTFQVAWTAAEMQAHFDAWATLKYEHTRHSTLGRTPAEVADAAAHTIRRVDVRALDLLLAPAARGDGIRTMTKTGIRIDHHAYHCGAILTGERVFVRRDPQDLGRVYLFRPDGETFLGEALNPELAGLPAAALIKAQREIRAEVEAERSRAIKETERELRKGPNLAQRARKVWERDAAAREAARADVVRFPRPEVEHSTPALVAALDAVTHRDRPPVAQISEAAAATQSRLLAEAEAAASAPTVVTPIRKNMDTPELRFRRALALEARVAASSPTEVDELLWLGGYQQTPEYRVRRKMLDEHGEDAISF